MCVTKKKQKKNATSVIEKTVEAEKTPAASSATPSNTSGAVSKPAKSENAPEPGGLATKTTAESRKLAPTQKESMQKSRDRRSASEDRKAEEKSKEKTSEQRRLADGQQKPPPPVEPPQKRFAKRALGEHKDSKDPAYATLDDDVPKFERAILRGNSKELDKVEGTQPSSGETKKEEQKAET